MFRCKYTLFGIIAVMLAGCGLIPEKVGYDDPRLVPLWKAVSDVDRAALGFTPVLKTADIRLERAHRAYDAMLHIADNTSRTIAFRKAVGSYKWIGEQEIHRGPQQYKTVDGTFYEEIVITFETEHVSGAPLNQISVQYHGEDARLAWPRQLTLDYVRPIIQGWGALRHNRK